MHVKALAPECVVSHQGLKMAAKTYGDGLRGPHVFAQGGSLRGPAAILFVSRDTCSDSIPKLCRACFYGGYRTMMVEYVGKWGITEMWVCKTKYQVGVSHHFGKLLNSLSVNKYLAIWGIAAIVSQYRAIWGH